MPGKERPGQLNKKAGAGAGAGARGGAAGGSGTRGDAAEGRSKATEAAAASERKLDSVVIELEALKKQSAAERDAVADMEELWRKRYQVAQDRGSKWKSRADRRLADLRALRGGDSGDEDSVDFSDSDGDEPPDKRRRFVGPSDASEKPAAQRALERRQAGRLDEIVSEWVQVRTPTKAARLPAAQKAALKAEEKGKFVVDMIMSYVKQHDNTDQVSDQLMDCLVLKHLPIFVARLDAAALADNAQNATDKMYLRIAKHVVNKVFESFDEQWSPMRCVALKSLLHLSRDNYDNLIKLGGKTWQPPDKEGAVGKFVDVMVYGGVPMPKFASVRKIRALEESLVSELGLTSGEGASESAVVSFRELLTQVIRDLVAKGVDLDREWRPAGHQPGPADGGRRCEALPRRQRHARGLPHPTLRWDIW